MSLNIDPEELEETLFYIKEHLGEQQPRAVITIRKIIKTIGVDQALAYLKKAREIEKSGGLLTARGKRRTIGGVYFHLVKSESSPDIVVRIWPAKDWKATKAKKQAEKQAS